jgi:deoxyribodipyrimidine photo-lyase
LVEAALRGPVVLLYVYEPGIYRAPEHDTSHLVFVNECLRELDLKVKGLGHPGITYRVGNVPEVLEEIHRAVGMEALYSHEETGNGFTYERDLAVGRWAKSRGIPWHEFVQTGVVRRLKTRDGWARRWDKLMATPLVPAPSVLRGVASLGNEALREADDLGLSSVRKPEAQRGGEDEASAVLESFLFHRGTHYRSAMSSPVEGWEGCSRLSPHLAYGSISMKAVYQATRQRVAALREEKKSRPRAPELTAWLQSLSSFNGRLHWHCHFMQKLEDEPRIEFENMSRACDGLRENDFRADHFEAWKAGQTGYPMVDACMRALHQGGWINFRMRAMLMSFASYHLWLHWRPTSVYLASQFLDFEPGIHFSQAQMQSGTTGINAVRIYSPSKQAVDQDPEGVFIRRYVPELEHIPKVYLAEPWKMPRLEQLARGIVLGKSYPAPIVDHAAAVAEAKRRIFQRRRSPESRQESEQVYAKHGSRRGPRVRPQRQGTLC